MTKDEALKLALEALEKSMYPQQTQLKAIAAIKEALAQPSFSVEQEFVAMTITGKLGNIYSFTGDYSLKKGDKIYTTPPQRTWVGLTEEELQKILQEVSGQGWKPLLESIEAKLKEKNT